MVAPKEPDIFFSIPLAHGAPLPAHALELGWEAPPSCPCGTPPRPCARAWMGGFPFIKPCMFHQTMRQIGKTRCYTNVGCCEVKILQLELFPGSTAAPILSGVNTGGYIVCSFVHLSFSLSHALAWPLGLGIRTLMLWRGPSSGAYGLPRFCVAPRVGDADSCAFAWF